ncbi:MAG TPA: hypothetical protein VGI07_10285 [Solirubrobacteraceae bacterium]|jgi:hypothetical protein
MGRTWILDTETKGTGAHMVPLERATKRSPAMEPVFVPRKPARPQEPQAPAPRTPRKFRIIDVMTRQTLADGSTAREAVDVLGGVRSIVDVEVYAWDEQRARWRLLTISEQRAMWEFARS